MNNDNHRVYKISVASVYVHYVNKVEGKGRSREELDAAICWLTGHSVESLHRELDAKTTFEDFFAQAPRLNPVRVAVTGVVCGVRIEDIEHPLMRDLRIMDKLVDELAKGRPMEKVLRVGVVVA